MDPNGERMGIALALKESSLLGDYNGNGLVEQGDLDLVLGNWGTQTPPIPPTWTNDPPSGLVDQQELDRVLGNWGRSGAASVRASTVGATGVPEPGAAMLLLLAVSSTLVGWRRSCRFPFLLADLP
jgi:hypothetical protein